MNKDKSIKDLKQYNDKIKNQLEYSKIRVYNLEKENDKLQQRIDKAVEITQNLLNTENSGYYKIIFQKQLDTLNGRSDE